MYLPPVKHPAGKSDEALVGLLSGDGRLRPLRLPLKNKSQNGISYVHFIAPPAEANPGVYLEWVRAEADGAI